MTVISADPKPSAHPYCWVFLCRSNTYYHNFSSELRILIWVFLVTDVEKLLIFSAWVEALRFYFWTDEFCRYSSSPPEPAGGNWKWVLFSASLVSSFAAQRTNAHTHSHCVESLNSSGWDSQKDSLVILLRHHLVIRGSGEKRNWKIQFLKNTDYNSSAKQQKSLQFSKNNTPHLGILYWLTRIFSL